MKVSINKLKTREEITTLVESLKKEGKSVVTINGSFDLLHAGHLDILTQASEQGDKLVVGLNSEKSIKTYKSPDRPILSDEHRVSALANLAIVDYITLFDESESLDFVKSIKPSVHVNGGEHGHNCIEAKSVRENGGRIHIVEKKIDISTSEIIEKIKKL